MYDTGQFVVSCPRCGTYFSTVRSYDKVDDCDACGFRFYTFVESGAMIQADSNLLDVDFVNELKKFACKTGIAKQMVYFGSRYSDQVNSTYTMQPTEPMSASNDEERRVMRAIRRITAKGANAEVKAKGDGTYKVYLVKKELDTG